VSKLAVVAALLLGWPTLYWVGGLAGEQRGADRVYLELSARHAKELESLQERLAKAFSEQEATTVARLEHSNEVLRRSLDESSKTRLMSDAWRRYLSLRDIAAGAER